MGLCATDPQDAEARGSIIIHQCLHRTMGYTGSTGALSQICVACGEHRGRRCQPPLQTNLPLRVPLRRLAYLSPLVLRIRPTAVSLELPFDSEAVPFSFQTKIQSIVGAPPTTISLSSFLSLAAIPAVKALFSRHQNLAIASLYSLLLS